MDFKDQILAISTSIDSMKSNIKTEEATKNAFIMPFINALGYNVFNPLEVVPEMCCDIGTKKGEKIDYAIMKDGEPSILIECKHWEENLNLHNNQLLRYFNVSKAKFGILTNGIIYRFYSDLADPNRMDEKPFWEINMLDLKETQIEELKKFHKSYFDVKTILGTASELKYTGELKSIIAQDFQNPSAELVKYLGKQVYEGKFTDKIADQFTPLVKKSILSYINDIISDRLKAVIKDGEQERLDIEEEIVLQDKTNKIKTTTEEMEAFYIIKSILRTTVDAERITYRDAQTYFAIFIDGNNRKTICRLYLGSTNRKVIAFLNEDKKEMQYKIDTIDDIYHFADKVIESTTKFI